MNTSSKYSIKTTSVIDMIFFSVKDVLRILSSDDVLVLKKHLPKSPTKENLINLHLTNLYWGQFRKKVLIQEKLLSPPIPKPAKRSGQSTKKAPSGVVDMNILAGKFKPLQELKFFKAMGTNNVNCLALGIPRILVKSKGNK